MADDLREITKHHFSDFRTHLHQMATQAEQDEEAYYQQQDQYQDQYSTRSAVASKVQYDFF